MILVSKCLLGIPCRMGMPTPREPSEIQPDGKVINRLGEDVTEQYRKGAMEALRICRETGCTSAILKSKSPSCGSGIIHNGKFDGGLVEGNGIFTDILLVEGIPVMSELDYIRNLTDGDNF